MVICENFIKINIISFHLKKQLNMDVIEMVETVEQTNPGTISSRKVILWGRVDVLAQAVGQFLKASMTWEVIRVPTEDGVENLVEEMRRVSPDVVILCQERKDDDAFLPILLIQEQLCPKVVTVELESNLIQVYSKQNVIVRGANDLLSIIDSGIFPDCTHGYTWKGDEIDK